MEQLRKRNNRSELCYCEPIYTRQLWERGADFYLSETESGLLCERGVSDLGPVYLPASSTCGVRLAGRFTNSDAEANSYTDSNRYADPDGYTYTDPDRYAHTDPSTGNRDAHRQEFER
jgi:hypothetical protein